MKTNGGKINKLLVILFIQSFIVATSANGMFLGNKGGYLLRRELVKQIMQKPQVVDNVFFNKQKQFVRNSSTQKLLNSCRWFNNNAYIPYISYGMLFLVFCLEHIRANESYKSYNESHKNYMEAHKKYMDKRDELTDYKRDARKKVELLEEKVEFLSKKEQENCTPSLSIEITRDMQPGAVIDHNISKDFIVELEKILSKYCDEKNVSIKINETIPTGSIVNYNINNKSWWRWW